MKYSEIQTWLFVIIVGGVGPIILWWGWDHPASTFFLWIIALAISGTLGHKSPKLPFLLQRVFYWLTWGLWIGLMLWLTGRAPYWPVVNWVLLLFILTITVIYIAQGTKNRSSL